MKRFSAVSALVVALAVAVQARATTCDIDLNCHCGETCNPTVVGEPPQCQPAAQDPGGHCVQDSSCIYIVNGVPQTCSSGSCTPPWQDGAVCILATASTSSTGGSGAATSSGGTTGGTSGATSGGAVSGSATGSGGAAATSAGSSTGSGGTGGVSTGGTGTGGAMGSSGGTNTSSGGTLCQEDSYCDCGQVCRWSPEPHICVPAGSDVGTCIADTGCLYVGQTCNLVNMLGPSPLEYHCQPAWSEGDTCYLPDAGRDRPQSSCGQGSGNPVWFVGLLGLLALAVPRLRRRRLL